MSSGRVLLVRRAIANVGVENDKGGPFFRFAKDLERMLDTIYVVRVADSQDIPTVSQKSGGDIFGEGDSRVSLDRYVIVVVDPAEVVQTQMSGERCGLR